VVAGEPLRPGRSAGGCGYFGHEGVVVEGITGVAGGSALSDATATRTTAVYMAPAKRHLLGREITNLSRAHHISR
jgi:hypothetical protein